MNPKRSAGEQAGARPLLEKIALGAVGLGVLSPFVLFMGSLGGGDFALEASIFMSELAMGISLACLLVAFVNGSSYTRQALSGVAWKLSLPFITSWPVFWIGMMGYGLGGDTARSERLGKLLATSAVLFFVVPIAGAFAARRGRNPNART